MLPSTLILIGYRGTGKTTIARRLAEKLDYDCVDADQHLEAKFGQTIQEIFAAEGEAGFRDKEAAVLQELLPGQFRVIATGGGAILRPTNRVLLRKHGFVIWLRADAGIIQQRLDSDPATERNRPSLTDMSGLDEIKTLLAEREPLYQACADLTVDTTGRSPEDVVQEILRLASTS